MKIPAPLRILIIALTGSLALSACSPRSNTTADAGQSYDLIIRGGTVYDGSGNPGRTTDVAINGDRIAAIGDLSASQATTQILSLIHI